LKRPRASYETTIEHREVDTLVRGVRELMPTQTFLGCTLGGRRPQDSIDIPVDLDEEEVLPRSQRTVTGLPPARVARRGPPPLPFIPPPVAVTVRPPVVVTVSTRSRRSGKAPWFVALVALGLGLGLSLDPSARAQARREGNSVLGALAQLVAQPEEAAARVEQPEPAIAAPEVKLASVSAQPSSANVEWWTASAPPKSVTSAPPAQRAPAVATHAATPPRPSTPARAAPPPRPAPPPAPAPKKESPRPHAADDGEAVRAAQEARQQLANTF
jgi:hypothetical protein